MKHEAFPDTSEAGRGQALRAEVTLLCEVRQGAGAWSVVRLEDISQQGFRISWWPRCLPGQPLRVKIPGLQVLDARICWQEGNTLGCAFSAPLHVAVFEHIVAQAVIDGPLLR